jgi:hypothetical protein
MAKGKFKLKAKNIDLWRHVESIDEDFGADQVLRYFVVVGWLIMWFD